MRGSFWFNHENDAPEGRMLPLRRLSGNGAHSLRPFGRPTPPAKG
jgi:hypothetical protein